MSDFIEEFYYGNIEPQECTTELKPKVMNCLNELAQKEKHLMLRLALIYIINAIEEIILNEIVYR